MACFVVIYPHFGNVVHKVTKDTLQEGGGGHHSYGSSRSSSRAW